MTTPACIFCDIVAGRAPASPVYRDDVVGAFMDIRPINPGHLLVIPVRHSAGLAELDPATGGHLFQVGQRLAAALRTSGVRCEGIDFFLADGEAAGQEVLHVHLHVLPRYAGDGFGLRYAPGFGAIAVRKELEPIAAALRLAVA